MTVCISRVANQAYGTLHGPHFLPRRQNPSLMAHKDKRGLYCWRVVGLLRKMVCEVYGAGCYGGATPFSRFQSRAEGLMTGWMVFWPFFWACVIARDRAPFVSLCQSALRQWGPQSSGLYLSFSCAMGCAGTPGLFNALFDSAPGCGDKGRESECACGRRWGLGQASIFNLCTVNPKHSWTLTVDHTALFVSNKAKDTGGVNKFFSKPTLLLCLLHFSDHSLFPPKK